MKMSALIIRAMCCSWFLVLLLSASVLAETPKGNSANSISTGQTVWIEYTLTLEDKKVVDTNVGKKPPEIRTGIPRNYSPAWRPLLKG